MAKKAEKPNSGADPNVDIERIKKLMGPFPDEVGTEGKPADKKSASKSGAGKNQSLNSAAAEANAALKAMSPDMGRSAITKIDDNDLPTAPILPAAEIDKSPAALTPAPVEETSEEPLAESPIARDDPITTKAVDDIVASESDEVLDAEDEKKEAMEEASKPKHKGRFRAWLAEVWSHPAAKWVLAGFVALAVAALATIPVTRYFILNNVGVRASLKLRVLDNSTLQPLKNSDVSVGSVTARTDSDGTVKLEHLKLGSANLKVSKRAFATIEKHITVGWGSNPQGDFKMTVAGAQYTFTITDFLSNKPIEKAEAVSGDGNAVSDKNGKLVITLDTGSKSDTETFDIQITAAGYRTETLHAAVNLKAAQLVKMVPSQRHVFVSNRSGKYDVYSIDVDGKNEKKIVAGTGLEREGMALVPQQNSNLAAYVATRENAKNSDGYLLSTLYLLDTTSGDLNKVDQSEQIQIIGWASDGRLVYVKVAAGASAANPKRQRIVSLNGKNSTDSKELSSANAFSSVFMFGNTVIYVQSGDSGQNPKAGLYSVKSDGSAFQSIYQKEIWTLVRTGYDALSINAAGSWYGYVIGAASSTVKASSSASQASRLYIDSGVGAKSLWVDSRDGKGVLLSYDKTTKKDTVLLTKSGLGTPLYWLNSNYAVYRVSDGKEITDYAINTDGTNTVKITSVVNSNGIGSWNY